MEKSGCSMHLVKYLIFFFNFIFFLSGLALIIIGAMIRSDYGDYFSYADSKFATAEIFIIVIGIIVFMIGFFGCCGALKENYCMICFFAVLLSIIFILEIAAGIVGYQYRRKVEKVANSGLDRAITNYNKQKGAKQLLDWAQSLLKCCGKTGPRDYDHRVANATRSICGPPGQGVSSCHMGDDCKKGLLYQAGCKSKLVSFVKKNMYILGGVAVGVAFIQVFGVILACCLMRAIKRDYEVM